MNKYMDFKAFRKDLDSAMEEVGKKYGISLKSSNISYDETSFTVKVIGERTDVDVAKLKFISDLKYMSSYGFTEDDYGKIFTVKGKNYNIVGFKPGNKYDVVVEREDGNQYAMVSSGVIRALHGEK